MALTINHPEIDKLAHELMSYTGETLTQVLLNTLRERLEQEKAKVADLVEPLPPRVLGLHEGQGWISEDFNAPLPDEFWLGE